MLVLSCALAVATIVVLDCVTPRGISISALYVVPIILIQRARSTTLTIATALCSGICASIGIVVSPDIGMPANMVLLNYGIVMVVIGATTLLGILAARRADQLQKMTKLLTLCAWTKQVKLRGEWQPIETYLRDELGIVVTHGIADECAERLMAEAGIEFGDTESETVQPARLQRTRGCTAA